MRQAHSRPFAWQPDTSTRACPRFHSYPYLCVRVIAIVLSVGDIDRGRHAPIGEPLYPLVSEDLEELLNDVSRPGFGSLVLICWLSQGYSLRPVLVMIRMVTIRFDWQGTVLVIERRSDHFLIILPRACSGDLLRENESVWKPPSGNLFQGMLAKVVFTHLVFRDNVCDWTFLPPFMVNTNDCRFYGRFVR